ncbi:extracellular calcium-sensing receptor-like [Erpetoichthys calabaricus]|uniref:extracellular calcium-sensing receptor-like n=1 Tax=Erpetoichthys calabaricus TaxID=27687 RepID=UPI0022345E0A|nr:extracellular calcium-sensing receptor-like [Erpetoichthys calabaricus]
MIFAIEEINNSMLLPGASLGYKIYDDCSSIPLATKAAMDLVNGPEGTLSDISCIKPSTVHAIIGMSDSSPTIAVAKSLGPLHIPVVSYYSTCACLSNKHEFPTFFRTIPSDYYQSRALAQLVKHFGWTWVGAVSSDNDYGKAGITTFIEALQNEEICIEYSEVIYRNSPRDKILKVVETMKKASSKVVVAFATFIDLEYLINELLLQNITSLQWVGSEGWIYNEYLATEENYKVLGGAIGINIMNPVVPGLQKFLMKFIPTNIPNNTGLESFWESTMNCTSAGEENTANGNECLGSETVYRAVYAIAYSVHHLFKCQSNQHGNYSCGNAMNIEPWQVLDNMKHVNFTTSYGETLYFDENGDPAARYELINWQPSKEGMIKFVKIGVYDASLPEGQQFVMNNITIMWKGNNKKVPRSACSQSCFPGTRKAVQKGKPICCFDCIPCAEGEITNITDSPDCLKCPIEYKSNDLKSQCILKEIEFLAFEETTGILLVFFSLLGTCFTMAVTMAEDPVCELLQRQPAQPLISKDGDIIIGGVFSFHKSVEDFELSFKEMPQPLKCTDFNIKEFIFAKAMVFASEELNNNTSILPGISLGYKIYDDCTSLNLAMKPALALANGQEKSFAFDTCGKPSTVYAIIGTSDSTPAIAIAATLGPYFIPLISYYSTCACLSNKYNYPTFFRTIPSDYHQSRALAKLIKYFGWNWLGTLSADDDYGKAGIATFIEAVQKEGLCIEYSESIYRNSPRAKVLKIVDIMKQASSKVIVVFATFTDLEALLKELYFQNVTNLQWIGSEGWISSEYLATKENYGVLGGALGLAISSSTIPSLGDYLKDTSPSEIPNNIDLNISWRSTFNCSLKRENKSPPNNSCQAPEFGLQINKLYFDIPEVRIANNVYKAMYAVAHALHNLYECQITETNNTCSPNRKVDSRQVLEKIKQVNYTTSYGENVYFDSNGNSVARYEIINWQLNEKGSIQFVIVGLYDSSLQEGQQFVMNNINIIWKNAEIKKISHC